MPDREDDALDALIVLAMKGETVPDIPPTCDLCGDQPDGPLYLHARCHLTAPLQASVENGVLTLRCYVPECSRVVATFNVAAEAERDRLRKAAYKAAQDLDQMAHDDALHDCPPRGGDCGLIARRLRAALAGEEAGRA